MDQWLQVISELLEGVSCPQRGRYVLGGGA
jgi:hypothetical protein